tara:strand:+ start:653 stop:922 length:270 start_codon:yes stop_codon:yes gene_type:complete
MTEIKDFQKEWDEEDHKHYLRIWGNDYKSDYNWRKQHGDLKGLNLRYCNACGYDTEHTEDGCKYHQRVRTSEDGESYVDWDEFNQDGET